MYMSCVCVCPSGIIPWGDNVGEIEEMGRTAIQQIRTSVRTPLVSLLLRGSYKLHVLHCDRFSEGKKLTEVVTVLHKVATSSSEVLYTCNSNTLLTREHTRSGFYDITVYFRPN